MAAGVTGRSWRRSAGGMRGSYWRSASRNMASDGEQGPVRECVTYACDIVVIQRAAPIG